MRKVKLTAIWPQFVASEDEMDRGPEPERALTVTNEV